MKDPNTYCVIMAGGIGTRFWPMSTTQHPKQFHDVLGTGKTLLQQTFERLLQITSPEKIYVITDQIYTELVLKQLPEISKDQIIEEPVGMNTAPCALYSALKIEKLDSDAKILVCPSDHLILNENKFAEKVNLALNNLDKEEGLYTLGIQPTRPDTGYGYIQFIEEENEIKQVKTFTEKPDKELAEQFLMSGDFLWNSGIFIWKAGTILKAFEEYLPDMYQSLKNIQKDIDSENEEQAVRKVYPTLQKISIDNGIMEKCRKVFVIPANFGWSDLGTWSSLYENMDRDRQRNAVSGKLVKMYDAKGNIVQIKGRKAAVIAVSYTHLRAHGD